MHRHEMNDDRRDDDASFPADEQAAQGVPSAKLA